MRNQSNHGNPNNHHAGVLRLILLGLPALMLALGGGPVEAKRHRRGRQAVKQKPAKSAEGVVNINTASEAQLELLPGIGPSKARAIARYRSKRKFRATYELIRIRGIGRKTFRRLRSYLTVKGPTTLTQKPRRAPRKQQR